MIKHETSRGQIFKEQGQTPDLYSSKKLFNDKSPARLTMYILRGHYCVQQKIDSGNIEIPKEKK